ncbi:MAG: hypothetical protein IRZ10_04685 [Thermoflavifilum sp.]|nr:hypothetical protein [Thermoflavifilum sp.]MCL6513695.1 hypothetical protein [Alicyclobacillus sp.]
MQMAICPYCHEEAYSSAGFEEPWTCPTCGEIVIPPNLRDERNNINLAKDPIIGRYVKYWLRT